MDKRTLNDYIDICELIKEKEHDISQMRSIERVHGNVIGSNPDFPYQKQHFHVSGVTETFFNEKNLEHEKEMLIRKTDSAKKMKRDIEKWMDTIPARMQRIIRMKYFEGESWETIAARMGRNATADSVRKEFDRFMRKK